jgi:hypothetical protein
LINFTDGIWNFFIRLELVILCFCIFSFINNRPVTAALYKKGVSKPRQWRSLESSVIVLRLRKCDNIGNFHRKKVRTPSKCESPTLTQYLKPRKYNENLWCEVRSLYFLEHFRSEIRSYFGCISGVCFSSPVG